MKEPLLLNLATWSESSGDLSSLTPERQFVIDNLANGQEYEMKIRYVNDHGAGVFSPILNGIPFGKATAPRNLAVVEGDGLLTFSWEAPENLKCFARPRI